MRERESEKNKITFLLNDGGGVSSETSLGCLGNIG